MHVMKRRAMALAIVATGFLSFLGIRAEAVAEERPRLVFTSNSPDRPGFLGGISGADQLCRETAEAGGLSGVFLAWVGDGAMGPANRFEPESGPLVNVHGDRVAPGWRALASGPLDAPVLHLDGSTAIVAPWSNVRADGTSGLRATACDRWWTVDERFAGAVGVGEAQVVACDSPRPFVCVEQ